MHLSGKKRTKPTVLPSFICTVKVVDDHVGVSAYECAILSESNANIWLAGFGLPLHEFRNERALTRKALTTITSVLGQLFNYLVHGFPSEPAKHRIRSWCSGSGLIAVLRSLLNNVQAAKTTRPQLPNYPST
jgi:hypothetical protein